MVIWCKECGAFMGLREPLNDWTTDRCGLCVDCSDKAIADRMKAELKEDRPDDAMPLESQ